MSTLQTTLSDLLDVYSVDFPVLDNVPEKDFPGLRETAQQIGEQVSGVVAMTHMGLIGPEEFEQGMTQYGAACVVAGIRAGQALAAAALDDVESDLASLDDGFPWDDAAGPSDVL